MQSFVFETPRSYLEPRPLAAALPEGPKSDLWEIASTALNEGWFVENINARDAALAEAVHRVRKKVYEQTGVSLDDQADPFVLGVHGQWGGLLEALPSFDQGARQLVRQDMLEQGERDRLAFNARLAELKAKYPDKDIPASLEDEALALQREVYGAAESARQRAPGGFESFTGGLLGSLTGSFGDPLQVATLPIGMGSRTIVGAVLKEAAVNAGVTGGLELVRDKAAWKDVTGREYTLDDFLQRTATGAAFGGLLGGGGKFLQQGAGRLFFDRTAFEVLRKTYDALPPDHPFREDETVRRAMDNIRRVYEDEANRPAGTTPDADQANRAAAARAAADPDAEVRAPDPVRDELVGLLDRGASAEEIWESQAARDADAAMAGGGSTLERGQPIPEGRSYALPDGPADADGAIDWILAHAREAAGPEGVANGKRALFIMGYGGAGKSTFVERFARRMRAAFVDADQAKTIIPEYEGGAGSQRVHLESVALRKQAIDALSADGANIVFETIGANTDMLLADVNRLKGLGYDVQVAHVRVDPDEAVRRSWRRYLSTGRSIQPAFARSVHGLVEPAWDRLVDSGAFSGYLDIDYSGARADASVRPLEASRDVGPRVAGDGRGAGLAADAGGRLLGEAEGARSRQGIADLEDEVERIVAAAREAAEGVDRTPPPTSTAAVFDSTLDPALAKAADDPTDANLIAAVEVLEREIARITGEGVDDEGNEVAFSFGGRRARTANREALAFAEAMAGDGRTRDEIWAETWDRFGQGWFQGLDSKWRFEIDDRPARLRVTAAGTWDGRLSDFIADADAGGAYPQLKNIRTDRAAPWQRDSGYTPGGGITFAGRNGAARLALLHERQHAIQLLEGFAFGTSPMQLLPYRFATVEQQARWDANVREMRAIANAVDVADLRKRADRAVRFANSPSPKARAIAEEARIGHNEGAYLKRVIELEAEQTEMLGPNGGFLSPHDTYRIYAGEVEARNVEARSKLTSEQRRARPPWTTQDTPDALQFVAMAGDEAFSYGGIPTRGREPVAPPATADEIKQVAAQVFGGSGADAFDVAPPPKWAPEDAKAYTVKKTGRVVLLEGRVSADEVVGLVLHEIGAHAGIERMVSPEEWTRLLATVMRRAKAGEGGWAGVLDAIPRDTPPDLHAEEALGYFLEMNAGGLPKQAWWRELADAVKRWALKALPWLERDLSDEEIRQLAIGAVRARGWRSINRTLDFGDLQLEARRGDEGGRIYSPGAPDSAGFITSAELAFTRLPTKFRDAKALTADQWRSALKAGGASAEAMTWQVEPALALINEGGGGKITRAKMEEAMARARVTAFITNGGKFVDTYSSYVAPGPHAKYRQQLVRLPTGALGEKDYFSHNWELLENVIGHIRTTVRRSADGERVLHVEELQSDLHQEGAQNGYQGDPDRPEVQQFKLAKQASEEASRKWFEWKERQPDPLAFPNPALSDEAELIADAVGRELFRDANRKLWRLDDLEARSDINRHSPPRAPMESWEEPFVRHVLQTAAKDGIDTVTFPTHATLHSALQNEGTQKFYDQRLPNTLARVAKSLGLKVEAVETSIPRKRYAVEQHSLGEREWYVVDVSDPLRTPETIGSFTSRQAADAKARELSAQMVKVPAIRLTPEAKEQLAQGVVAYSQGSPTGRAQPAPAGSPAANPKQPQPGQSAAPAGPPSPALARERYLAALKRKAEKRLGREWLAFRNGSGERDAGEFLQAILDYQGQGSGLTRSVDGLRKTIISTTLSEIEALLHHFRAGTAGRRVNKADLDNFVKEMFGEDTGDPAAKALAQATAPALEKLRQRFNNAGGMIGKLDRWGLPQSHNALALRNWIRKNGGKVIGRDALRQRLFNDLDITRMRDVHTGKPMTGAEVFDALDTVIQDMLSDGWATRTPSRQPVTPGMLANRRADHRFLIFKDAQTWLAWQREFGQGDPATAVVAHVERMARDIAAMEILGPNPETTIEWLQQKALHEGGLAEVGKAAQLPPRVVKRNKPGDYVAGKIKRMNEMWENYTGAVNAPVNEALARNAAFLRNLLTSATLGSAIISAMPTDPVFQAFARSFAGTGHMRMLELLARQTLKNPREAAQMRLIMDHALASFGDEAKHARELTGPNRSAVLAGQVLAMSGLTPWTRGGRQLFGMGFLADMGNLSGDAWADLPKAFQRTFTRYGIAEPEWDAMRAAPLATGGFLSIANVQRAGGLDLADRVTHMILQETEYAVPSGTLRSRSFMRGKDQAGTFMGELRQSGRMFLSFGATLPMLYGYRLAHQLRGGGTAGEKVGGALYFGALAGTLMFGGAIAMQAKNIRDGKDLQDMRDGRFWQAAFLQGGGLGIYGDFLFGNLNRMDRSLGETFAGPAVGFISDAQEATLGELQKAWDASPDSNPNHLATIGKLILGNAPGSTLWYFKGAWDRWIEDGYQHLVDPQADDRIRRRARELQRTTGQGYFWARGSATPQRGPVMAEAPPPQTSP